MSVRLRLTLLQTFLLGLVLAGFAVIVYAVIAAQEQTQLTYELQSQVDAVQRRAVGEVVGRGPRGAGNPDRSAPARGAAEREQRLTMVLADRLEDSSFSAEVVRPDGTVIARTSGLAEPLPLPAGFLAETRATGRAMATVSVSGEPLQALAVRVDPLPRGEGIVLIVATSRLPLEATLRGWRMTLVLVVLGTIAVSAAIAWFMASRALRPVDQMTVAARAIGQAADFSRRVPEPAPRDELGRLARTFNEMLERLAEAYSSQRRFLADASHELRTPLSVINTNAAALLDGIGLDPAERTEALRAIARESTRMGRLVADLLTLARSDAGQAFAFGPVSLDALVLEVYQQHRALAGDVRLELGEWEQVEVTGDADRLKQVVVNLVDNALRHTPPGGTVTLDLERSATEAILRVRDTGIGIAPAHHERIFERFYRVDQPRSRGSGGTGLGLAIAREVVAAHGGRLTVASAPDTGAVFTVTLPVPPATPAAGREPVAAPPRRQPVTS